MRRPIPGLVLAAFLALAISLTVADSAAAALNRWTSAGPDAGGPVLDLAVDPTNPSIVYAATLGGVFRSVDRGESWTAANTGLTHGLVFDLAVDSQTSGTLYAATSGGVQKSRDGGRTWQIARLTGGTRAVAVSPSNPKVLYASQQGTVYGSADGGSSWIPARVVGSEVLLLEVDPLSPATVYAGTLDGLFRSTNGGASWTLLATGWPSGAAVLGLAIHPTNPAVLYAGTASGKVVKSVDAGLHWTLASDGLSAFRVEALAIDPAAPDTLLALGSGVFRTTNGGASWLLLDEDFVNSNALAVSRGSFPVYLLGGPDGVYRSEDLGATWQPSSFGLTASVVRHLEVDPQRPGSVFAEVHGGLYRTRDAGASWQPLTGVPAIYAFALDPAIPSVLYAATGVGFFKSVNDGAAWTRLSNQTGGFDLVVDPRQPRTMYLATQNGVVRSVDGGATWTPARVPVPGFAPYLLAISPRGTSVLYANDFDLGLYRSLDGGESWELIGGSLPSPVLNSFAVDPSAPDTLYAAVQNHRLYKSLDGGATWFPIATELPWPNVSGLAVDPRDSKILYAGNVGGGMYRSRDAGASWNRYDQGLLDDLWIHEIAIDPVNPFLVYAATEGGGVYARADLPTGAGGLRLNGDRFLAAASWVAPQGASGRGRPVALTADTGYAWFFDENNVEMVLKVLDGCGVNGHFWMFAGGLTNVRVDLTLADTLIGEVRVWHNPQGRSFQPIQDTRAFPCAVPASDELASAANPLAAGIPAEPLLLGGGRFRVAAEHRTAPAGAFEVAEGVRLTDAAGYLWFFEPANVEVFLKVLDACPVNGRFWVFAAGLTNVQVRLRVEDTRTGAVKVYENPLGRPFQPVQDTQAFACP